MDLWTKIEIARAAAHGLAAGAVNAAFGGDFTSAFLAGSFAAGISHIPSLRFNANGFHAGDLAVAALVGGTASVIGGGKFGNGAFYGAAQYLFNAVFTSMSNRNRVDRVEADDPQLMQLKDVKVLRLDASFPESFGHYWIEIGGEGFGWWPEGGASWWSWLTKGNTGYVNYGTDSYLTKRPDGIKVYDVYVSGQAQQNLQTRDYMVNAMRQINSGYSYYGRGRGCDCRTFQYDVGRELNWVLRRAN